MSRITTRFDATSTAADVVEGLDLTGVRAVVTGGATGIGTETTRALAQAGAEVTVTARRSGDAEAVASDIRAGTGNEAVHVDTLDLADSSSIRTFTQSWEGPLHILVNNAGVMALPELTRTREGREWQFGVNHLGHFALTLGLHRALAAAPGARIVAVSSSGHHVSPVDFDDIDFVDRPYTPWAAYGQSKTAIALFAVEATRRWANDGIVANSLMPGGIATDLQRHMPDATRTAWASNPVNKTPQQGAATSLVAAVAPEFAGVGGRYLEDGNEAAVIADDAESDGVHGVRRWALDGSSAERLWDVSLEMIGDRPSSPGRRTRSS